MDFYEELLDCIEDGYLIGIAPMNGGLAQWFVPLGSAPTLRGYAYSSDKKTRDHAALMAVMAARHYGKVAEHLIVYEDEEEEPAANWREALMNEMGISYLEMPEGDDVPNWAAGAEAIADLSWADEAYIDFTNAPILEKGVAELPQQLAFQHPDYMALVRRQLMDDLRAVRDAWDREELRTWPEPRERFLYFSFNSAIHGAIHRLTACASIVRALGGVF